MISGNCFSLFKAKNNAKISWHCPFINTQTNQPDHQPNSPGDKLPHCNHVELFLELKKYLFGPQRQAFSLECTQYAPSSCEAQNFGYFSF